MAASSLVSGLLTSDELDKWSKRNIGLALFALALAGALTYEDSVNKTNISNGVIYGFVLASVFVFVVSVMLKVYSVNKIVDVEKALLAKIDKLTAADFKDAVTVVVAPIDKATQLAFLRASPDDREIVDAIRS